MGALEMVGGGPIRDQRPRQEQRAWGFPFTHGCYSQLCQVRLHHHLLRVGGGQHCFRLLTPSPGGFLRPMPQPSS